MLWFYVGWYATSWVAQAVAHPDTVGPIVGFALALVIAVDPCGRVWRSPATAATRAEAGGSAPLLSGIHGT